ncbi:casein kinase 2 regulatory subunit [Kappamyces sp. JEL0829]|nr:casein kinase 2 regulatory subunit [Kappamyces sp. JEL0829]
MDSISRVSLIDSTYGDSRPSSDQGVEEAQGIFSGHGSYLATVDIVYQDDSQSSSEHGASSGSVVSWISWFCSLHGHEYFIEVPEAWIEDDFNLTGLSSLVPRYAKALDMILDLEEEGDDDDENMEGDPASNQELEHAAQTLYSLIHARFLITKAGLGVYKERYQELEFGVCPRAGCGGCGVVPCGLSDFPLNHSMKLYCPRCLDIYNPKQSKFVPVDGCAFGTTFHTLLFNTFPELVPALDQESFDDQTQTLHAYSVYIPKIFGFRVSALAPNGPKARWLRRRKGDGEDSAELL